MALLGLRVCHRPGPISYRTLFSAITSSVDKEIGPDNTRRLHQTAQELGLMNMRWELDDTNKDDIQVIRAREARIRDQRLKIHTDLIRQLRKAKVEVIRTRGPKIWDPYLKIHTDLLRLLGKAEVKDGATLYSSTRDGDDLQLSLIDIGLFFLEERGYPKVSTHSPEGKSDLRVIGKGVDCQIPKAVQPFRAYPSDEGIRPFQLPIRYAASSNLCLNSSVGLYSFPDYNCPYMPGTYYQTRKLSQVCITGPTGDESSNMYEELLKNCEDFYGALGISYRVVANRSDEVSHYILEGWFPGSKTYVGLANCSRYTDCQLVETQSDKRSSEHSGQRVHFLRANFMVTEFTIASVLENHQREDGVEATAFTSSSKKLIPISLVSQSQT